MFGNSSNLTKDQEQAIASAASSTTSGPGSIPHNVSLDVDHEDGVTSGEKRNSMTGISGRKSSEDAGSGTDKKRRSSGVAKASAMFASAKSSLHLTHGTHSPSSDPPSSPHQTPMQKLGKTDPALNVPQGSLNNSAGESRPGPRSTFRVGVTEDRNKKCRRTMEDTHAYLYNFLSTPAPVVGSNNSSKKSVENKEAAESSSDLTDLSQRIVETDNGFFAIYDGHAGTFAADWCGKKLHVLLEETIRKNPNSAIPELLDQTFTSVDQQLEKLPLKNSGCTAICAVLRWEDRIPNPQSATGSTAIAPVAAAVAKHHETPGNGATTESTANLAPQVQAAMNAPTTSAALPKLQESASRQRVLYTANVGDARIVLCRNGKALRLSYDHKGSDENEGRRITNAGGLILNNRVNGVLAVTRALGDAYMKDLVTGHPYTTETVIQPDVDEFLILACDGVSVSIHLALTHFYSRTYSEFLTYFHSSGMSARTKKLWTSFVILWTLKSPVNNSSTTPLPASQQTISLVWSCNLITKPCVLSPSTNPSPLGSKVTLHRLRKAALVKQTPLSRRHARVWAMYSLKAK